MPNILAMTTGSTLLPTGAAMGLPRSTLVRDAMDPLLNSLRFPSLSGPHSTAELLAIRSLFVHTPEVKVPRYICTTYAYAYTYMFKSECSNHARFPFLFLNAKTISLLSLSLSLSSLSLEAN